MKEVGQVRNNHIFIFSYLSHIFLIRISEKEIRIYQTQVKKRIE
jgi:hypothetical protein